LVGVVVARGRQGIYKKVYFEGNVRGHIRDVLVRGGYNPQDVEREVDTINESIISCLTHTNHQKL